MTSIVHDIITCPLSGEIMNDPVFAADGFAYERSQLLVWFEHNNLVSPVTNGPLPHPYLIPATLVKAVIHAAATMAATELLGDAAETYAGVASGDHRPNTPDAVSPVAPLEPTRDVAQCISPKLHIGAVIGARGKTVHMIEKRTNTKIVINQRDDPCIVTISGASADVERAKRWIDHIVKNVTALAR